MNVLEAAYKGMMIAANNVNRKEKHMFIIKPNNPADWRHAMFILSYYSKLIIELFSNGEDADTAYMMVRERELIEGEESDLRLAEMAFQMNWYQGKMICPHCEDNTDENACGHLTFTGVINPAF